MSYFEDGTEVVVEDLEGRKFIGEVLYHDRASDVVWVDLGMPDAIGVPNDPDRIRVFDDFVLEDEDEEPAELEAPPFGLSSDDLAKYVGEFIERATARVKGVGHEQYSEGDFQKFEAIPINDLLDMLQEELQDAAVYAAMLDIRIKRYRDAIGDAI